MTFSLTQTQYFVGASPQGLAVGDINGDGWLDIVASSYDSLSARVLFGNGDGTFGTAIPNYVSNYSTAVALGDLNGDGKLDLVAAVDQYAVAALQRPHALSGPFDPAAYIDLGSQFFLAPSIALIDVNNDGRLDIVGQSSYAETISILLGNGDGTFQPLQPMMSISGVDGPARFADVDGDGRLDLVFTRSSHNGTSVGTLYVVRGNGDGTFSQALFTAPIVGPENLLATGDVNGDGKTDIVTMGGLHSITVRFGNGDGTFPTRSDFDIPDFYVPVGLAIGDVNGDGKADFIVPYGGGIVGVMLGNGTGGFSTNLRLPFAGDPASLVLADFNKDGALDMAIVDQASGTVSILMNHLPVAPATNSVTTNEDTASASVAIGATDADNDALSYAVKTGSAPAKGAVAFGNGSFTYTPIANANGSDSFTILISDGNGHTVEQAVTVTINAVNDAAVAQNGSGSGTEDNAISGTLAASDVDGDALTYAIVAGPQHGTLTSFDSATGVYTYAPDANYHGADSFSFKANDGTVDSNTATISLTVSAVNDAPVGLVMITGTVSEDHVLTASNTLSDADGLGTVSYQWQRDTGSGFGDIAGETGGTYTLGDADVGAEIRVVAGYTDGQGTVESVASAATAAVTNVNDAPSGGVTITGTATED